MYLMTRTTISLHETTLAKVKELSHNEHISLGETITELLNLGLKLKSSPSRQKRNVFKLQTHPMGPPKIPLEDKDAIHNLLHEKG